MPLPSAIIPAMRVAIISPYSSAPMRGNITTVRRIANSLAAAGIEVMVLPVDGMSVTEMQDRLAGFLPRIIHGFHACHTGDAARVLAGRLHVPFVITMTGSDIHEPSHRNDPGTVQALATCAAVVCFDGDSAAALIRYFPDCEARLAVVPQGIEALPAASEVSLELPVAEITLLLPAALRPAKNVEFALTALAPLARRNGAVQLLLAGGVIDPAYAARIGGMLVQTPFAAWLGEIPHENMGALYSRADIVLNCSRFESMPNSLLEAMFLGRTVVAADIPGNRSLVRDGVTGVLYRDEFDFRAGVERLAAQPALRADMGRLAREFVRERFSPEREAERYIRIYSKLSGAETSFSKP